MKKTTRTNLIFLAVVLAVVLALFLLTGRRGGAGGVAVLSYGDPVQTLRIPLATDKQYDIDTGFYTIHLQVQSGGIAFVDSPCPDHTCENFGVLRNSGDWAACLPAFASLTVE